MADTHFVFGLAECNAPETRWSYQELNPKKKKPEQLVLNSIELSVVYIP